MFHRAICLLCFALLSTFLATHYIDHEKKNIPEMKLYDTLHHFLPFCSQVSKIADIVSVGCFSAMFYIGMYDHQTLSEFMFALAIIGIIRAISITITILPDHCTTIWNKYGKKNIFGGCRDKLFSGHTAATLLCSFFLYKKTKMSWVFLLPIIVSFAMLISREHYSIDVLFAWFITTLVWQNIQKVQ